MGEAKTPRRAPVVQDTFRKAASISERISRRVASPVIATSAALAQMQSLRSAPATLLRRTPHPKP